MQRFSAAKRPFHAANESSPRIVICACAHRLTRPGAGAFFAWDRHVTEPLPVRLPAASMYYTLCICMYIRAFSVANCWRCTSPKDGLREIQHPFTIHRLCKRKGAAWKNS